MAWKEFVVASLMHGTSVSYPNENIYDIDIIFLPILQTYPISRGPQDQSIPSIVLDLSPKLIRTLPYLYFYSTQHQI